jgi:hypothetical protein
MPISHFLSIIICISTAAFISCSAYNSLPSNWAHAVPGKYVGTIGTLQEVIDLHPDGSYEHRILISGETIVEEGGKWSIPNRIYEIVLVPNETFTEFYDPTSKTVRRQGKPFGSYRYWPLPSGRSFSTISASPGYEFRLNRSEAYGDQ